MQVTRITTTVPVIVRLGSEALNLPKDPPTGGSLFSYLVRMRAGDRDMEFEQ